MKVCSSTALASLSVLLLLSLFLCVDAYPQKIVLIRHAEKPADDNDPNLSEKGYHRATAFIKYFNGTHGLFTRPSAFFAMGSRIDPTEKDPPGIKTVKTLRAIETVQPSAEWLRVPIFKQFIKERPDRLFTFIEDEQKLHQDIFSFNNTVVICWEHDDLNDIFLAKFGLPSEYIPKAWPGHVYDMNYVLTFSTNGKLKEFDIVLQHLLPSDAAQLDNKDLIKKQHVVLH